MPAITPESAADLFRGPPDDHIDVPGGSAVAYRRLGSGPDVLFVHGWPVSGATFRKLLPYLAEHATCHLIDLAGTGQSRFDEGSDLSIVNHIAAVRTVIDRLGVDALTVVGHDSGGMIARHAAAEDDRVTAMGLVNTEQPRGLSWRFRLFLAGRNIPGFGSVLGFAAMRPRLRRNGFILGDAFVDADLLDGEFEEFFLRPLDESRSHRDAAIRLLRSFDVAHVTQLGDIHRRLDMPVQMVWGDQDPFFPLPWAREMVDTFPDATLDIVEGAGLFSHEERPQEVAASLLKVIDR